MFCNCPKMAVVEIDKNRSQIFGAVKTRNVPFYNCQLENCRFTRYRFREVISHVKLHQSLKSEILIEDTCDKYGRKK